MNKLSRSNFVDHRRRAQTKVTYRMRSERQVRPLSRSVWNLLTFSSSQKPETVR